MDLSRHQRQAGVAPRQLERRRLRERGGEFLGENGVESHAGSMAHMCPFVKDTLCAIGMYKEDTWNEDERTGRTGGSCPEG